MLSKPHKSLEISTMRYLFSAIAALFVLPGIVMAETQLSFYGGIQGAPHSVVSGNDPGGAGVFSFTSGWEGRSFESPPYYGGRITWWRNESFGWGLEFNHAKVYASAATLAANGLTRLEFSDGLNLVTVNAFRRWQNGGSAFTPYVGAGVGVAIPHVEFDSGAGQTFEYQLTGPAAQWVAGASYPINDKWSVFGEYKGSYSMNEAELVSGGTLSTNILTNAINLGVSLAF
jgi:lipid A oxidase